MALARTAAAAAVPEPAACPESPARWVGGGEGYIARVAGGQAHSWGAARVQAHILHLRDIPFLSHRHGKWVKPVHSRNVAAVEQPHEMLETSKP